MYDIIMILIIAMVLIACKKIVGWKMKRHCWDCRNSAYCIRDNYPTCPHFRRK